MRSRLGWLSGTTTQVDMLKSTVSSSNSEGFCSSSLDTSDTSADTTFTDQSSEHLTFI